MKRGVPGVVLGALSIVLCGCTNGDSALRLISVIPPADTPIRFSADVQPIFNRNCASSGCHAGGGAAQGLNLETGNAYRNLVNVASAEASPQLRVVPGHSEESYLVDKLLGNDRALGDRMPAGGASALPDVEIQLIRDWIDQGADDN